MKKNIFFDERKIKHLGKNAIIGKTVRIRHPQFCSIGDNSIIDDFTYISTKFEVGQWTHIATNVTVAGGKEFTCSVGDFCGLAAGSNIWCVSSDIVNDVFTIIPKEVKSLVNISGDVIFKDFTGVGGNSIVMPNVTFSEGATVGGLSIVPPNTVLKPWTYYGGIPVKPIKKRNKELILKQADECRKIEKNQKKN